MPPALFKIKIGETIPGRQTLATGIRRSSHLCFRARKGIGAALGLSIRTVITPGQWGDSPQVPGRIEELTGTQHVLTDAACDADHLHAFIADDLGATAHTKAKPGSQ